MQTNPTTTDLRLRGRAPLRLPVRSLLGRFVPTLLASALTWTSGTPAHAQQAGGPALAQQAKGSSRERSGLAEDQALLQRQLARLRQTMEVLATRFEAEGRTHAAKLLREGLSHLGERALEQDSKTVDELMGGARSSLESGQTVQAVEVQDAVVRSLEKLYSILTDRQGLDDLEHSLEALRKIKVDLSLLANREKELRERTSSLEQDAAAPERQDLKEGIQKAIAAQRDLLSRTEARARENGEMELDAIARELEALAARQATDTAVLESWKPEERSALEASSPPLRQAAERATAAQRLSQAARELREAAAVARDAKGDLAAAERDLEASAAREERRERTAGETPDVGEAKPATDARASKALRAGSQALSRAPATPPGRENAARSVEEQAAGLEKAAEAELAAAREAREAAQATLDQLARRKTAAGEIARRARDALPGGESSRTSPDQTGRDAREKKLEERAEEEARADAEAGRALSTGLDEQATLPKALSASQAGAAEDAARLERALGARPEGRTSPGNEARKELTAAADAQKSAAESASKGDADGAAAKARSAQESLASAREALARVRAASAADSEKAGEERALAREQEELAKSVEDLERQAESGASREASPESGEASPESRGASPGSPRASSGSPNPQPGSPSSSQSSSDSSQGSRGTDAKSSLSAAKGAMQSAAKSLKDGAASSASSAQRQAIARLQQAAESARKGAALTRPEDREKAQALSKEQEKIRNELLDLSRRNQKRDTAKPSPSLSQAGSSASKAKEALDEGDLDRAQGSEEDTERKMREALSQLSEEEEQYQKLRAEELLFKVAEQVKGMLEAHRDLMRETLEVDGARQPGEPATHTQRLRLRKISKSEEGLASRASEVGQAIRAEESLVFAEVLDEAGRDLTRAARDLGEDGGYLSGERVQARQQDIEQGLAWLYEALQVEKERRRQEESQSGNQPSSQQRGRNRLVPDAAELKLLRRLEVENLDSLEKFKAAHPEIPGGRGPEDRNPVGSNIDPLLLEDLGRLANRHQRTSDLFEKFRKRLGLPDPPSQEP